MSLLYHAYVYLEFLILACTIYILAPGLANRALGDEKGACRCFNKLMDYGERHLYDKVKNDLPRKQVEPMMQTKRRRKWKCHGKWQFHFFVRLAAHVANG